MSFVMQLDSETLIELIDKAREKDIEEKLWQRWLTELPRMNEDNFISFDEYKKQSFKRNEQETSTKSEEEVLEDANKILKSMSKPK